MTSDFSGSLMQSPPISELEFYQLQSKGWLTQQTDLQLDAIKPRLLNLAASLGIQYVLKSNKLIETLQPSSVERKRLKSLTSQFGLAGFPWHTDLAHKPTPAKYIILGYASTIPSTCTTQICDSRKIRFNPREISALKDGLFLVRNGRNSFYSSILSNGRDFIRFDPGCMEPQNRTAEIALELIQSRSNSQAEASIGWQPGQVLILDNRYILHRRSSVGYSNFHRTLYRVMVTQ